MKNKCKSLIFLLFLATAIGGGAPSEAKVCFVVGGCGGDSDKNKQENKDCESLGFHLPYAKDKPCQDHMVVADQCTSGGKIHYKCNCDTSYYNLTLGDIPASSRLEAIRNYFGSKASAFDRRRNVNKGSAALSATVLAKYDYEQCSDTVGIKNLHIRAKCKASKYKYGTYNEDGQAVADCRSANRSHTPGGPNYIPAAPYMMDRVWPDAGNAMDVADADVCVMLSGEHAGEKLYNGCVCPNTAVYKSVGKDNLSGGYQCQLGNGGQLCNDTFNEQYCTKLACPTGTLASNMGYTSDLVEPGECDTSNNKKYTTRNLSYLVAEGLSAGTVPTCGTCEIRCKAPYSSRDLCVAAMKDNLAGNILSICRQENNDDCTNYYNLITPENGVCPMPLNEIIKSDSKYITPMKNLLANAVDFAKAIFGVNDAMAAETILQVKEGFDPVLANAVALEGKAVATKASVCATFHGQCYDAKTGASTACSGSVNCPTLFVGTKGAAEIFDRIPADSALSKVFTEKVADLDNKFLRESDLKVEFEPNLEIIKSIFVGDCNIRKALEADAKVGLAVDRKINGMDTAVKLNETRVRELFNKIDSNEKLTMADFAKVSSTNDVKDLWERPALKNFEYIQQLTQVPNIKINATKLKETDSAVFCPNGGYKRRIMCEIANGLGIKELKSAELPFIKATNIEALSLVKDKSILENSDFKSKFSSIYTADYAKKADLSKLSAETLSKSALTSVAALNADKSLLAATAGRALTDARVTALTTQDNRFATMLNSDKVYEMKLGQYDTISNDIKTKYNNTMSIASLRDFNPELVASLAVPNGVTRVFDLKADSMDQLPVVAVTHDTYECVQAGQCWFVQKAVDCTPKELPDGSLYCKECEDKCTNYDGYYDTSSTCNNGVAEGYKCVKETDIDKVGGMDKCYKRVAKTCADYSEGGYKLEAAGCMFTEQTIYTKKLGDVYGQCYKSNELVNGYDGDASEKSFIETCGILGGRPVFSDKLSDYQLVFKKDKIADFASLNANYKCAKIDAIDKDDSTLISKGLNGKFGLFLRNDDMPSIVRDTTSILNGRATNFFQTTDNVRVLGKFSNAAFKDLLETRSAALNNSALQQSVTAMNALAGYNESVLDEGNESMLQQYRSAFDKALDAKSLVTLAAGTSDNEDLSLDQTAVRTTFQTTVPNDTTKSILKGNYSSFLNSGVMGAPARAPGRPGSGSGSSEPEVDWDDLW